MPIQERLLELLLESSGALRQSPTPEQFSAISAVTSASLCANQLQLWSQRAVAPASAPFALSLGSSSPESPPSAVLGDAWRGE